MNKGYLAIELTASRIRFVHMERDGRRGCRIRCCGEVAHALNIEAPGALTQAIQSIFAKESLNPERLFVSLCSQENFIRQMLIPRMSTHDLEEAIKGEIEKFPVFTRHAFDYIYHAEAISREKNNVVFAAIEDKTLKYLFDECQKAGIPFQHLEIAPLNLKELLPLMEAETDNQVLLFVDDHISYLMIVAGRQYHLIYQSGIGLEILYPAQQKGNLNENVVFSLLGELQRVFKAYLSQNKTEKLKKLWLVWDRQKAPQFDQVLTGQLGLEVSVLGLDKIAFVKDDPAKCTANPINALVATPLLIYLSRIKSQFPLDHFFRALHIKRYIIKALLIAFSVIIVAGGLLGFRTYHYFSKTMAVHIKNADIQRQISELKDSEADIFRQRDEYLFVREGLLAQANFVKDLNRISWTQVLSVMAEKMPEMMRLTSFKFNDSGSVSFFGESLSIETIAELIRRVDSSTILENGRFDFLSEKPIDANKYDIFQFAKGDFKGAMSPEALLRAISVNKLIQLPEAETALEVLNKMLERNDLYSVMPKRPDVVSAAIARMEDGEQLSLSDLKRVNRLVIENNYPAETPQSPKLFSFGIVAQLKAGSEEAKKDNP